VAVAGGAAGPAGGTGAAAGSSGAGGAATGGGVRHVSIVLPDGVEVGSANLLPIALSDDGTRVAYVGLRDGKNRIYVRTLSEPSPRALDGTEGGDGCEF